MKMLDGAPQLHWKKFLQLGKQSIPFLIKALKDKISNVRWCSALSSWKISN
jgi:hypothetical protein